MANNLRLQKVVTNTTAVTAVTQLASLNVVVTKSISATNLSGNNTGDQTSITGNAGTATKLETARNINGVAFDGSANVNVPTYFAAVSALTISAGVVNIDLNVCHNFTLLLNANVTSVTFSNIPASGTPAFVGIDITQDATGGRTFASPTGTKWPGGTAYVPTATANATDTIFLKTEDAGTTWRGVSAKAFA